MFSSSISDQPSDLCVAPLLALLSMLMFSRGNFFFKPIRVNKGTRTGCGVIVFRGDGFFLFYFFRFGSDLLGLEGVPSVWGIFYSSPFNLKVTF